MTKEQALELGVSFESESPTQEEIDTAVLKRVGELTAENSKQKDLISRRNGEIAEYKRKEQDKMSEDEKMKLHYEELEKENASYKRSIAKTNKVNEYLGIGYPKELAEKIAENELDGKSTASYHAQFTKMREETIKAELMKGNPAPRQADPSATLTQEGFKKMSYAQKLELKNTNPEAYAQLSKK